MHPWIFILFAGLLQSKPPLYLVTQFLLVLATACVLRLPLCSLKGLPLVIFPSVLNTFSILALQNVSAHHVLFLPPSWKQPCLQGTVVLSFDSLENGICGIRMQCDELVFLDAMLSDPPTNRANDAQASLMCLRSTW